MNRILLLILIVNMPYLISAQSLKQVAKLPDILEEASGLEIQGKNKFWTHNDDQQSIVYCLDSLGQVSRAVHIAAPNHGWEDLSFDDAGNLFIGGFGNNANDKHKFVIYMIPNPDSITEIIVRPERIQYSYPDQREFPPPKSARNFDMEAMITVGDSIYLFSKNWTEPFTGYSKLYRLPKREGEYVAELIDSIYLGPGPRLENWVTSADISPDGKKVVLLSHGKIWVFSDFEGTDFFGGNKEEISLNDFSHKTGVCFMDNHVLYLVDEKTYNLMGGNLYKFNLHK